MSAHSSLSTPSASGRYFSTRTGFRSHRTTVPSCATALYSRSGWEAVAFDYGGARAVRQRPQQRGATVPGSRWEAFYARGSRYALALQSKWSRLQWARNGAITVAGLATPPIKTVLDASAKAFGHKAVKLHRAIFNEIRSYRSFEIYARACKLTRDDPRRRACLGAAEGKVLLQSSPASRCHAAATPHNSSTLQPRTRSGCGRAA